MAIAYRRTSPNVNLFLRQYTRAVSRVSIPSAFPKRRILYVHHAADLGGASLSLLSLIDRLDKQRYAPTVLFNCQPQSVLLPFRERGIPFDIDPAISTYPHAQGAWLGLRSLRPWEIVTRSFQVRPASRRFREYLASHPCDLVHLNSMVQVPAALGAWKAGVPVVWHIREELHPGYLGLRRAWIRRCIERCATHAIVISKQNAAQLPPGLRTTVVYNSVDFDLFDRSITGRRFRSDLGLSEDVPLVGMLGGVLDSKGADVFTDAARLVRRSRPKVVFLIAGIPPGGESPSALKRIARRLAEGSRLVPSTERRTLGLIRRHGLTKSVRIIGMRRDIPDMLAACAILVWPASVSHFARPIIEAGAMARPVIASDFPSSRELVVDGETGLLTPPGDPGRLAEAILRLLDHPDDALRMGEQGHALARERYDSLRNARAVLAIYDSILGRDGGPA
jgi:glycosyltransferase involved in cell wall biosynthesis